ncbi:MAG: flagellar hook protein FlgE [Acidobacteria bacterium]|nr:flagellar hook protein FlgE [Acidobacteriota bacterium]
MPSFSIPLSGLSANSQALSVIANNLANMNTVGYKSTRALFRDLFYQQVGSSGSGNPLQVGVGVTVSAISTISTQGSIESSGVPTDVAIQGDGFFVVDQGGARFYTRAGNFSLDANGVLVTANGENVLGYLATNGVINTNQTLSPMAIATGQINPPNTTTNVQLNLNLDANEPVGTLFSTAVEVNDPLGATHILNFDFTKASANNWTYQITIPAADVGAAGAPVVVNSGTVTFDGSGTLTAPAADVTGINITGFANGSNDINFDWQLYDSAGLPLLSQVAAPSAVSSTRQDGFSSGTLQSFTIGSDGIIQGIFSNGQTLPLGQIALATFPNLQGLLRDGDNNFLGTLSSGAPSIGVPGTGGRGILAGSALELSNVDIAREFAQLILAQRGFQANSRAVTTFDEITQEAINLKR